LELRRREDRPGITQGFAQASLRKRPICVREEIYRMNAARCTKGSKAALKASRRMPPPALLVPFILFLVAVPHNAWGSDQDGARIRVLYHGDALEADRTSLLLMTDPMLEVTRVPSHAWRSDYDQETIRRFLRLYMPRNYEDLCAYGLIILSDASRSIFSPKEVGWFHQSVVSGGLALAMIGGYDSFGGSHGAPGWTGTTVEEILPVALTDQVVENCEVEMRIQDPQDPLMVALEPMAAPPFLGINVVEAKQGSRLLAIGVALKGEHPLMLCWTTGNGRTFALTSDWNGGWGANFFTWRPYPTYSSLVTYYSRGVKLPDDIIVYDTVRCLFYEYPVRRSIATSLLEFVERFGARTSAAFDHIAGIDAMEKEAESLYLTQQYESALSKLQAAGEKFRILSERLVKLKGKALVWVYIVEWLAVSGTAMVCGATLWTLMVRKRLYRQVRVTRSAAGT